LDTYILKTRIKNGVLEDRKFYMKGGNISTGENSVGIYMGIDWKTAA